MMALVLMVVALATRQSTFFPTFTRNRTLTPSFYTLQHIAVARGDLDMCRALVAAGASGSHWHCGNCELRDFESHLEEQGRGGRWVGGGWLKGRRLQRLPS